MISENTEYSARISQLVSEILEADVPTNIVGQDKNLADFGLTSVMYVTLLVALEETFQFAWSEDTDFGELTSIRALAAAVERRVSAAGAEGESPPPSPTSTLIHSHHMIEGQSGGQLCSKG